MSKTSVFIILAGSSMMRWCSCSGSCSCRVHYYSLSPWRWLRWLRSWRRVAQDDKSGDDLAVMLVLQPDDAGLLDGRMGEEDVFDLERGDVFAAADDEVFDAAGDLEVAVEGEEGFVACLREGEREG